MEKMVVVVLALAAALALAVPAGTMGQEEQDSVFSGFSLDDIQGLVGNLDQVRETARNMGGGDGGVTVDDVKQAAEDFQNQDRAEVVSLDDVKTAAETSFQGASDQGGSSWMDWAKDKLTGSGLVDGGDASGPSATPAGQAPSPAPAAGGPAAADSPAN